MRKHRTKIIGQRMTEYIVDMAYTLSAGWVFIQTVIMVCWIGSLIFIAVNDIDS